MFVDLHSAQLSRHGVCTNHRQPSKLMSLEFCQVKEGAAKHRPNSRGRLPASAVGVTSDQVLSKGQAPLLPGTGCPFLIQGIIFLLY